MTARPAALGLPVLLVDDEPALLASASAVLRSAGIGAVLTALDSRTVPALLDTQPIGVLVIDLAMPQLSGQELLAKVAARHPEIPAIVMTATNDLDTAIECMQQGAVDFLVKPVESARLTSAVQRALELRALRAEVASLRETLLAPPGAGIAAFAGILTQDPAMSKIFRYLAAIASSPSPLLITGETGTGKELVAQAVHALSKRPGPLITPDVAPTNEEQFSDSLFGHVKGAFTNAAVSRLGFALQAADGTLFLDEIGELGAGMQAHLLRFLQDGTFHPMGSDEQRRSNARIIAATNIDVKAAIEAGRFRRDLYYRLATHHVHLPPLRARRGDVPLLVARFVEDTAVALGKPVPAVPPALYQLLRAYHFPGNVRELRDLCWDAVAQHERGTLSLDSFRAKIGAALPAGDGHAPAGSAPASWLPEVLPTLAEMKRALVDEAMRRANGNQGVAAGLLGITRQALNRWLTKSRDDDAAD